MISRLYTTVKTFIYTVHLDRLFAKSKISITSVYTERRALSLRQLNSAPRILARFPFVDVGRCSMPHLLIFTPSCAGNYSWKALRSQPVRPCVIIVLKFVNALSDKPLVGISPDLRRRSRI